MLEELKAEKLKRMQIKMQAAIGLKCWHCGKKIEETYYFCKLHYNMFCGDCKDKIKGRPKYADMPQCEKSIYNARDCIWEKKQKEVK